MCDKIKVLVCGARFGQFYMEAIKGDMRYELIGILARGSTLAQECAKRYETVLYTELTKVPKQIDIVCVAVKTGILGGAGTDLALYFLNKGISVILEQPIHYQDLVECYKIARKKQVAFHVGNLYLNLPQVKLFLALAERLSRQQKILYINVDMATQVSYPFVRILIEILGKAKGIVSNASNERESIFQNISLQWNETFVQIRAQNQEGNQVADNCMHLLFQITVGVNSGSLVLADTNGLIFWRERMEIPNLGFVPGDLSMSEVFPMREVPTKIVSNPQEIYGELLSRNWVKAVKDDVDILLEIKDAPDRDQRMARKGTLELAAAQNWKLLTQAIGYPKKICETDSNKISFREVLSEYISGASMLERYALISEQEVKEAVLQINRASLLSILKYFQDKGFFVDKEQCVLESKLINDLLLERKFHFIIGRWLSVLSQNMYIKKVKDCYCCMLSTISNEELQKQWEIALKLWKERLGEEIVGQYFYSSAMNLDGQLQGNIKANYLLYPEGHTDIAEALYRNTIIAWYMNQAIAQRILEGFNKKGKIRILEVGAGIGATSDVVIKSIINSGYEQKLEEYCYTDLSPYFLIKARERYKRARWLVTKEIDINISLQEQGIEEYAYDVIIAAGVINNVDDTISVLKNLLHCMKMDGFFYMSEAVGESIPMLISQVFMMQKAKDARENANMTFLSRKMWYEAFERAGLLLVDMTPKEGDKLYALEQSLFILRPQ